MAVNVYRSSDASAPVLTGQAGSLITVLDACLISGYGSKSPAGWVKPYSGTNLAAYRASSGNQFYFRVDDSGTVEARISGYETMSDVNTGTGQFPTTAQISNGLYLRKSETADATVRGWVIVATGTAVYILPHSNATDWLSAPSYSYVSGQSFFGDFQSFKAGDVYNTAIIGATATGINNCKLGVNVSAINTFSGSAGHCMPRGYDGAGTSKYFSKRAAYDVTSSRTPFASAGYPAFPDLITADLIVSPMVVLEPDVNAYPMFRGLLPGLWAPLNYMPGNHGDTIDGTGTLAGKSFLLFNTGDGSSLGRAMLEISNTW